jgi:hypothetical protein
MTKLYVEEVPSFALRFSFQSNMAFMLAIFIMMLALGWALRDHRRRLLELASEEQEDRLYLGILGILFAMTSMGSYYAFNQTTVDTSGKVTTLNPMVAEIVKIMRTLLHTMDKNHDTWPPYAPDMDVRLPMPSAHGLDERIKHGGALRSTDSMYNSISLFVLLMVTMLAAWYFFPPSPPPISPPRPYMAFKTQAESDAEDVDVGKESRRQSSVKPSSKSLFSPVRQ